jgi:hypothetical protein
MTLDESWSLLPYQIEDLSPSSRIELAERQKISYLSAIGTREDAKTKIRKICNMDGK